jgi:hypothetical protein
MPSDQPRKEVAVAAPEHSILRSAALAALMLSATAPALAKTQFVRQVNHQFRQVQLPTDAPGQFRIGLWTFNPSNGRLRLCVLNDGKEGASAMTCSAWSGGGPSGQYYLMPMRRVRRHSWQSPPGLWILNRQTGHVRACLITELKDPTGSLRCSSTQ